MAAKVFVGERRLTEEAPVPPTKTSRHETTINGRPAAAQKINGEMEYWNIGVLEELKK